MSTAPPSPLPPRYRFGGFVLSPARRLLLLDGREVPLIPRYFDLLLLLIERRQQAVTRHEIFDLVWSDVVVSDGALSQAVRTLRRVLGDNPREPSFIRTVSRHGYRFVHDGLVEELDEAPMPQARAAAPVAAPPIVSPVVSPAAPDPFETPLLRLLSSPPPGAPEDEAAEVDRREAAETLHALGTREALERLGRRPCSPAELGRAVAILRDTRWEVPGSGEVPLLGRPGAGQAVRHLIGLRLRRAARAASRRWAAAAAGGAAAGLAAGLIGGAALRAAPLSSAPASLPVALALVGAVVGALGAAGVGAGLAIAEALARSYRGAALVCLGAAGGGAIGATAHAIGRWTLEGLFGRELSAVGGGFEGILIGGAAGLGYALATPRREGGMATPRGAARLRAILITGACCAAAGLLLTVTRGHLVGVSLDFIARTFQGSQVSLQPLARMLGEPDVGPVTGAVLGLWEGMMFGMGLALGLTRRPAGPA